MGNMRRADVLFSFLLLFSHLLTVSGTVCFCVDEDRRLSHTRIRNQKLLRWMEKQKSRAYGEWAFSIAFTPYSMLFS